MSLIGTIEVELVIIQEFYRTQTQAGETLRIDEQNKKEIEPISLCIRASMAYIPLQWQPHSKFSHSYYKGNVYIICLHFSCLPHKKYIRTHLSVAVT